MSAASVNACLSPTILRKRAISSGESGGAAGWTIFIFVSYAYLFPPHSRAGQPVGGGFAAPVMRHRHDSDGARAPRVERSKIAEKIGGGLSEIAMRGQIHHCGRGVKFPVHPCTELHYALAGLDPVGIA